MKKYPPQSLGIEYVKGLNMVDFLSRHYDLDFSGDTAPRCISPFKEESSASFFVREIDGHWLFKDFAGGYGGSLIDFVLYKEGFSEVSQALGHINSLLSVESLNGVGVKTSPGSPSSPSSSSGDRGYDIEGLYHKFVGNDVQRCRDYLLSREICQVVVDKLCDQGLLLHNIVKGKSYCCFAVFNSVGQLCCLDNHAIEGKGKFVLGRKHAFSLDWPVLPLSQRVFVTESIIDYLSMKTLENSSFPGLALLGNVINFNSSHFASAVEIVSALDGDEGGFRAFLDLEESFSDREVQVYDFGDCKDANEYLQTRKGRKKSSRLSAQDKLSLYQDYSRSENKSELAKRWGINRSYMYEVVKECEELILSGFSQRRRGRKPSNEPETMDDARKRIENLQQENRRLDEERERHYVRNEFMKVRLKWSEREAEELRDEMESQSSTDSKNRKKHLKKKRRMKS